MTQMVADRCPEALRHGPPDGAGKCPFCGRKFAPAQPPPRRVPVSDLAEWYGLYYGPDWQPANPR